MIIPPDLRWYYSGEAEAALGLRGQVVGGDLYSDSDPHEAANRHSKNCARWADVRVRLRELTTHQERVLRLALTPHRWDGLERFYELAGIAALLINPADVIAGARSIASWGPAKQRIIRLLAEGSLANALAAYQLPARPVEHGKALIDLRKIKKRESPTTGRIATLTRGRWIPENFGKNARKKRATP